MNRHIFSQDDPAGRAPRPQGASRRALRSACLGLGLMTCLAVNAIGGKDLVFSSGGNSVGTLPRLGAPGTSPTPRDMWPDPALIITLPLGMQIEDLVVAAWAESPGSGASVIVELANGGLALEFYGDIHVSLNRAQLNAPGVEFQIMPGIGQALQLAYSLSGVSSGVTLHSPETPVGLPLWRIDRGGLTDGSFTLQAYQASTGRHTYGFVADGGNLVVSQL